MMRRSGHGRLGEIMMRIFSIEAAGTIFGLLAVVGGAAAAFLPFVDCPREWSSWAGAAGSLGAAIAFWCNCKIVAARDARVEELEDQARNAGATTRFHEYRMDTRDRQF